MERIEMLLGVRSSKRRVVLMQAVLLGMSLIVSVFLGEMAVRLVAPQELGMWTYTRDGMTSHFENMRQYSYRFRHEIVTNSAGMRDREHSEEKARGTFRILVLGDSFMEANQVKFEDSLVSLLERQLQKMVRERVEVINASVSGWGTDDELTYLQRRGFKYEPDLIIVAMTMHNDITDNLEEEYHSFQDGQLHEKPIALVPLKSYAILKVKEWLNAHSHLYRFCFQLSLTGWVLEQGKVLESHVGSLLRKDSNALIRKGWDMTEQLFGKLVQTAERRHSRVVVVLVPLTVQVEPERLGGFLKANGLQEEDIDIERPQAIMKELAERKEFQVIDLLPVLRDVRHACGCNLLVENDGHWNERGHKEAAEFVSEQLLHGQLVPGGNF